MNVNEGKMRKSSQHIVTKETWKTKKKIFIMLFSHSKCQSCDACLELVAPIHQYQRRCLRQSKIYDGINTFSYCQLFMWKMQAKASEIEILLRLDFRFKWVINSVLMIPPEAIQSVQSAFASFDALNTISFCVADMFMCCILNRFMWIEPFKKAKMASKSASERERKKKAARLLWIFAWCCRLQNLFFFQRIL